MKKNIIIVLCLSISLLLRASETVKVPDYLWPYAPLIQTQVHRNNPVGTTEYPFPLINSNEPWPLATQQCALEILKTYHKLVQKCSQKIDTEPCLQIPLINIAKQELFDTVTKTMRLMNYIQAPQNIKNSLIEAFCFHLAEKPSRLDAPETFAFIKEHVVFFKNINVPFFTPKKIVFEEIVYVINNLKKQNKETFITPSRQGKLFGKSEIAVCGDFLAVYAQPQQNEKLTLSLKNVKTDTFCYKGAYPQPQPLEALFVNKQGYVSIFNKKWIFIDPTGTEITITFPQNNNELSEDYTTEISENHLVACFDTKPNKEALSLFKKYGVENIAAGHLFQVFPSKNGKRYVSTHELYLPPKQFGCISQALFSPSQLICCYKFETETGKEASHLAIYPLPHDKEVPLNSTKLFPHLVSETSVTQFTVTPSLLFSCTDGKSNTDDATITISSLEAPLKKIIKKVGVPCQEIKASPEIGPAGLLFFSDKTNKLWCFDSVSLITLPLPTVTCIADQLIGNTTIAAHINEQLSILFNIFAQEENILALIALKSLLYAYKKELPLKLSPKGWGHKALKKASFAQNLIFEKKQQSVEVSYDENQSVKLENYGRLLSTIKHFIIQDKAGTLSIEQSMEESQNLLKKGIKEELFDPKATTLSQAFTQFITLNQNHYPFPLFLKNFNKEEIEWLSKTPLESAINAFKNLATRIEQEKTNKYAEWSNDFDTSFRTFFDIDDQNQNALILQLPQTVICTNQIFETPSLKEIRNKLLFLIFKTYCLIFLQKDFEDFIAEVEEAFKSDSQDHPHKTPPLIKKIIQREVPDERLPPAVGTIEKAHYYSQHLIKFLKECHNSLEKQLNKNLANCRMLMTTEQQEIISSLIKTELNNDQLKKFQDKIRNAYDSYVKTVLPKRFNLLAEKFPRLILPSSGKARNKKVLDQLGASYGFTITWELSTITPQKTIKQVLASLKKSLKTVPLYNEEVRKPLKEDFKKTIKIPLLELKKVITEHNLNHYFSRVIFFNKTLPSLTTIFGLLGPLQKKTPPTPSSFFERPLAYNDESQEVTLCFKEWINYYFGKAEQKNNPLIRISSSPLATHTFFKQSPWKKYRDELLTKAIILFLKRKPRTFALSIKDCLKQPKARACLLKLIQEKNIKTVPPSQYQKPFHKIEIVQWCTNTLKKYGAEKRSNLYGSFAETPLKELLGSLEVEKQEVIHLAINKCKNDNHDQIINEGLSFFLRWKLGKILGQLKFNINKLSNAGEINKIKDLKNSYGFTILREGKEYSKEELLFNVQQILNNNICCGLSAEHKDELLKLFEQELIKELSKSNPKK